MFEQPELCEQCHQPLPDDWWHEADCTVDVEGSMAQHLEAKSVYRCPDAAAMQEANGLCAADACFSLYVTRALPGGVAQYCSWKFCCSGAVTPPPTTTSLFALARRHWRGVAAAPDELLERCLGTADAMLTVVVDDGDTTLAVGQPSSAHTTIIALSIR